MPHGTTPFHPLATSVYIPEVRYASVYDPSAQITTVEGGFFWYPGSRHWAAGVVRMSMQMRSESNNHTIYREKRRSRKSGLDTHTHTDAGKCRKGDRTSRNKFKYSPANRGWMRWGCAMLGESKSSLSLDQHTISAQNDGSVLDVGIRKEQQGDLTFPRPASSPVHKGFCILLLFLLLRFLLLCFSFALNIYTFV